MLNKKLVGLAVRIYVGLVAHPAGGTLSSNHLSIHQISSHRSESSSNAMKTILCSLLVAALTYGYKSSVEMIFRSIV